MSSEVTACSTTDSQEQVESAVAHDEAVGHGESPAPSGGTVIAVSTTGSQADIARAAMRYAKDDAKIYGSGAEFPGSAGIGVAVGNPNRTNSVTTDGVNSTNRFKLLAANPYESHTKTTARVPASDCLHLSTRLRRRNVGLAPRKNAAALAWEMVASGVLRLVAEWLSNASSAS
jgi:hypothetical protein